MKQWGKGIGREEEQRGKRQEREAGVRETGGGQAAPFIVPGLPGHCRVTVGRSMPGYYQVTVGVESRQNTNNTIRTTTVSYRDASIITQDLGQSTSQKCRTH